MKSSGTILVDTNVLIYASETPPSSKAHAAKEILRTLWKERRGVISVQNLAEFSSVRLKRLQPPLKPADVSTAVGHFSREFRVLSPDASTVSDALDGVARHGLSFWDAMLWSVARQNGVVEILSEDFQNGREVEGVLFTNPF